MQKLNRDGFAWSQGSRALQSVLFAAAVAVAVLTVRESAPHREHRGQLSRFSRGGAMTYVIIRIARTPLTGLFAPLVQVAVGATATFNFTFTERVDRGQA